MKNKPTNNKQVKQLCTHYFFGTTTVEVDGVWDSFEGIRPDDYDSFELFVVDPKYVGMFWSVPNKGHIPTEEEVRQIVSEKMVVGG